MILITGATGTIGSNVVKQLEKQGMRFTAGVRNPPATRERFGSNTRVIEFDFDKPETVSGALNGIQKVFLLTTMRDDQVQIARSFVETAKAKGVKHIVRLSAMGADVEKNFTLGRWHHEIEEIIKNSGIAYTFLRPNSFFNNITNFLGHQIRTEGKIYMPLGNGKVSFVAAEDVARVAVAALTQTGHENATYTITGPEALSMKDVATELSDYLGKNVTYIDVNPQDAKAGMLANGFPDWAADAILELYALNRSNFTATVTDDVMAATGRKPLTLREWLKKNGDALRN